jgi:4-diphosphocytidyl-2-C-methyl-D-erythritol kinase
MPRQQPDLKRKPARAQGVVRVHAPAKLNFFLHVDERRADGFHDLESLVAFTEAGDLLTISPAENLILDVTGHFAGALSGTGDDNLVLRAARALGTDRGAHLTLQKNLPVASGIGGGSADAAAALRGLNAFWELSLREEDLAEIGASLGSDIPACVLSRPLWMSGRGEVLRPLEVLPPLQLVLVNPRVALSTTDVFSRLNTRTGLGAMSPPPAPFETVWDVVGYLRDACNDLEAAACSLAPVIEDVLEAIAHEPGCILSQMSGSGATCFGLFQEGPWASGAAERLALDRPQWWVRETRIAASDFGVPTKD